MNAEDKRREDGADGRVDLEAVEAKAKELEGIYHHMPMPGSFDAAADLLFRENIPKIIAECRELREKVEALTLERDDARTAYRDMKAVLRLTVDERDMARALLVTYEEKYGLCVPGTVVCVYCSELYVAGPGQTICEAVLNHTESCEAHPLYQANVEIQELKLQLAYLRPALPSDEPEETVATNECPHYGCYKGKTWSLVTKLWDDCPTCHGKGVVPGPGGTVAMVKCPNERCDRGTHRSGTEGHPGLSWTCQTCKGKGQVPMDAEENS